MMRVLILFGGKSAEHEISIRSAQNIVEALNTERFEPVLVGIDHEGIWHQVESLPPKGTLNSLPILSIDQVFKDIDVVFPVLHGPLGEDGAIQGLLRIAGIPFVGPGVLGSAVNMDKDVEKRLLREAGLPVVNYIALRSPGLSYVEATAKLGATLFIKPANMGSSVGISKVTNETEYQAAIELAFLYDRKLVIEECIVGRELECGVLGNADPQASVIGEIMPNDEFYSYEAKYLKNDGARRTVPANLPKSVSDTLRQLALAAYTATECEGLARVDFFLQTDGSVVINELNTLPGFTNASMYPELWQASGLNYANLITRLLDLAIEHGEAEQRLLSEYQA